MGDTIQIEPGEWNLAPFDRSNPYLRLWKNVLNLGLYDFQCSIRILGRYPSQDDIDKLPRDYWRDAVEWVLADDDRIGSFVWICELLGHNPSGIRWKLKLICGNSKTRNKFITS